jgi:hypothetical protein
MGRHTIWQQGLAINECRLAIVHPDPKYKSQLLAKTCRDEAQQGESKGRWKEHTEQVNNTNFFSWIFLWFFQKALVGIKLFYFFHYFFIIFVWIRIKKDATKKIGTYNWGGIWFTEIQHILWKACKNFEIFFSLFPEFFGNFDETKQDESICCWEWVTVARWTYANSRIRGAMGRHTIWQQGLAINECRFTIVQSGSKVQITAAG